MRSRAITCIIMEFAHDIPLHLFVIKFEPRSDGLSKELLVQADAANLKPVFLPPYARRGPHACVGVKKQERQ